MLPKTNLVGIIVFLGFPFFVAWLFRKYPVPKATVLAMLISIFYLPDGGEAEIDLPLVPSIRKDNYASLVIFFILLFRHPSWFRGVHLWRRYELVPTLALFGIYGTQVTNQEVLTYGTFAGLLEGVPFVVIPPLTLYDTISSVLGDFFYMIVPYIVGRAVIRTREDMRFLFQAWIMVGLSVVPLMMLELRLSPQVHIWVYGYYPHDFTQSFRWGGFRPQVFFQHGLVFSRAMFMVLLAALALWLGREKKAWRFEPKRVVQALLVIVFLSKSMGIVVFMAILAPLYTYAKQKTQLRVTALVAVLVLAYPMARATGAIDMKGIIDFLYKHVPERAQSLEFRFRHEIEVSERTAEKMWFGWGGYGRGHIWDAEYGKSTTVIDGYWLGRYSSYGLFGLFPPFLVMLVPLLALTRRFERVPWPEDRQMLILVCGMGLVYAMDNLPNANFDNVPFFIAGAAWTLVERLSDPTYIRSVQGREGRRGRPLPGRYPPRAAPWAGPTLPSPTRAG